MSSQTAANSILSPHEIRVQLEAISKKLDFLRGSL
jgi:hypothetical protein